MVFNSAQSDPPDRSPRKSNMLKNEPVFSSNDVYTAFMMDHANGVLPSALTLAADLHTALSETGASIAMDWDVIGGALLENFSAAGQALQRRKPVSKSIPASDIIATDFTTLRWRRGLSGVSFAHAGVPGGRFMRLREGQAAPSHGHSCLEATVVLQGAFDDGLATYRRGDLAVADKEDHHTPRAVGGDCVCYVGRERSLFWIM